MSGGTDIVCKIWIDKCCRCSLENMKVVHRPHMAGVYGSSFPDSLSTGHWEAELMTDWLPASPSSLLYRCEGLVLRGFTLTKDHWAALTELCTSSALSLIVFVPGKATLLF